MIAIVLRFIYSLYAKKMNIPQYSKQIQCNVLSKNSLQQREKTEDQTHKSTIIITKMGGVIKAR